MLVFGAFTVGEATAGVPVPLLVSVQAHCPIVFESKRSKKYKLCTGTRCDDDMKCVDANVGEETLREVQPNRCVYESPSSQILWDVTTRRI